MIGAEAWMDGLNPAQRESVLHGDGPLLVVAGAGTGKTWTLACRVARLIVSGVPPERVLLLTFTRRAAREMLARARRLTGESTGRVWGGTFHAVANRLLRHQGRAVGMRADFTVMDQGDAADLMNLIRSELGLAGRERRFPRKDTLAAIYSRVVNSRMPLAGVLQESFPWCVEELEGIRSLFERYTARKRSQNVLDYDDLLLYWNALVRTPVTGPKVAGLFDHILVDEYQDTNVLQAEILQAMRAENRNLTVVGDDAQAIYSFRAASVRNILEFTGDFPGARIVRLEQNYRSTQPILDVSNAVIARAQRRHHKMLWSAREGGRRPALLTCLDEAEQCDEVCRRLLEHREEGIDLRRQAVLFRAAHHSDQLEVELTRRNIPFVKYGGLKFLEAAHVKDALAVVRILENPFDEVSWFRVLQLLDGMGPRAAERAIDALGIRRERGGGDTGRSPLRSLLDALTPVPASARREFEALRSTVAQCVGSGRAGSPGSGQPEPASEVDAPAEPSTALQLELIRRFLEPIVARRYQSPAARLRDLEQLELLAVRFPSRARFLTDLTLDPPSSTGDLAGPPSLDEDYVILSTIHSAKGGEWDIVHVIHAADGMIPSDMATGSAEGIEEERRLLYVALTRARDALYVYFPLRYYRRPRGLDDAHSYAQVSRFLPEPVRVSFDQGATFTAQDPPRDGRAGAAMAVDAFLSDLWGR